MRPVFWLINYSTICRLKEQLEEITISEEG